MKWMLLLTLSTGIAFADDAKPKKGPPQVMIDACAKHKEGDACSFKRDDKDVAGKCAPSKHEKETLVCRRDHKDSGDGKGSGSGSSGKH